MKFKNVKMVKVDDWDNLVKETYNKHYNYQQQDGCQDRGLVCFDVPEIEDDYKNDTIPEVVNGPKMGVSFKAWLARDPKEPLKHEDDQLRWLDMFWARNFYPDISMIINDLYKKGILEKGTFAIDIDW